MTERNVTILGFVAASAVPPILVFVISLPSEASIHGLRDALVYFAVVFLTFFPAAAFFGLMIGGPAFFVAHRLGIVTWWLSTLVGALAGALGAALLFSRLDDVQVFALFGSVAGLVFWLVWRRRSNWARHEVVSENSEF